MSIRGDPWRSWYQCQGSGTGAGGDCGGGDGSSCYLTTVAFSASWLVFREALVKKNITIVNFINMHS